jgi:hypothetical protein
VHAAGLVAGRILKVAWERLLASVDSAVEPPAPARLVNGLPVVSGISASMIVTLAPASMFPSRQTTRAPTVHRPLEGRTETILALLRG